jgi:hypothetical protein
MSHNNGLTRVDMMAAVLRRRPRRTVRELIAPRQGISLEDHRERSYGKLYIRRDKFEHTPPDRSTKHLVVEVVRRSAHVALDRTLGITAPPASAWR